MPEQLPLQIDEKLYQNTIFEGLTPEQIAQVLPCIAVAVKYYGPDECIADPQRPLRELGVVLDGDLIIRDEGDGKVVDSIGRNGLLGEAALAASDQLPHRVVTDKGAQILFLSGAFFLSPCGKDCGNRDAHQIIVGNMLRLLSERTISLNKKIAYLTAEDLKTKIAMYLWELYQLNGSATFNMPLNRDRLAEYFSVARPSLSRELTNLRNMGIIDFHRSSVTILDVAALQKMAGR